MSRIYMGDTPCPGCGKPASISRRAYKDGICFNCMRDLQDMKNIKEQKATQKESYVRFFIGSFSAHYLSSFTGDTTGFDCLVAAIKGLLISLNNPEKEWITDFRHSYSSYSFPIKTDIILREDTALALDAMLTAIENYSHDVYSKGKKDGSNLLCRLGKQEITPSEFIEARK